VQAGAAQAMGLEVSTLLSTSAALTSCSIMDNQPCIFSYVGIQQKDQCLAFNESFITLISFNQTASNSFLLFYSHIQIGQVAPAAQKAAHEFLKVC